MTANEANPYAKVVERRSLLQLTYLMPHSDCITELQHHAVAVGHQACSSSTPLAAALASASCRVTARVEFSLEGWGTMCLVGVREGLPVHRQSILSLLPPRALSAHVTTQAEGCAPALLGAAN